MHIIITYDIFDTTVYGNGVVDYIFVKRVSVKNKNRTAKNETFPKNNKKLVARCTR